MTNRTALEAASAALARRDHSAAGLEEYLAERGIERDEAREAIERLSAAGYLNDGRVARARATSMGARGYGDAAIRADLKGRQLPEDQIDAALAELDPEPDRARLVLRNGGTPGQLARRLAARGFPEDVIESLLLD
jgi:regulatory protein